MADENVGMVYLHIFNPGIKYDTKELEELKDLIDRLEKLKWG